MVERPLVLVRPATLSGLRFTNANDFAPAVCADRRAPLDAGSKRSCTSTCTLHEHVHDETSTGDLWD